MPTWPVCAVNRKRTGKSTTLVILRRPAETSRDGVRISVVPVQGAERELGARHQQFGAVGPGHGRTRVRSGEQPTVFKQVQPVQRRESATAAQALQGCGCSPEHREPLIKGRTSGFHRAGHGADGQPVFHPDRVLQDEPEIDVAHQRTEPSVREAAERITSDQA